MATDEADVVELLIFGTVRRMETYFNFELPREIVFLLYVFYGVPDRFEYVSDQIEASEHRQVITKKGQLGDFGNYGNSTFGRQLIDCAMQTHAQWIVKVRHNGYTGYNEVAQQMAIGIVDSRYTTKPIHRNRAWYLTAIKDCAFYAYQSGCYWRTKRFDGPDVDLRANHRYRNFPQKDSRIGIDLNLKKKTLRITYFTKIANSNELNETVGEGWFRLCDEFRNIACSDGIRYRLAVTLFSPGDSVEIEQFVQSETEMVPMEVTYNQYGDI